MYCEKILYKCGGRMFVVDKEKCNGCQNCMDCCPCGAIREDDNNEGKCVIDCDLCAECGACEAECPFEAIKEVDESETEQK